MENRGPGQWHFPDDVLDDEKHIQQFQQLFGNDYIKCPPFQWEALKLEVKSICQQITRFRRKQRNNELSNLHKLQKELVK